MPFGACLIGEPLFKNNAGNGRAFSILTGRAGGLRSIKWKKQQKEAAEFLIKEIAPRAQPDLLDFADLNDEAFFDQAEEEIVAALRQYAEKTSNGKTLLLRLFAEDAARGFAFVDVSLKQFDVVLMNPPFGDPAIKTREYLAKKYPEGSHDICAAFVLGSATTLS